MKDHTTVPIEIAEHCEKIEKETKAFLSTNVDTEELCIVITTKKKFDEVCHEESQAQDQMKSATKCSVSYHGV